MALSVIDGFACQAFQCQPEFVAAAADLEQAVFCLDFIIAVLCGAGDFIAEGVGALALESLRSAEGVLRTVARCKAVAGDIHGVLCQRCAVIFARRIGRGEHQASRTDLQRSVFGEHRKLIRDIIALRIRHPRGSCHGYRPGSRVQALSGSGEAADGKVEAVDGEDGLRKALQCLGLSVVQNRVAHGFHRDAVFAVPVHNSQCAGLFGEIVVGRISSLAEHGAEAVQRGAGRGLAAGHFIVGTFAGGKAVAGDRDALVFLAECVQRTSVILL